MSEDIAEIARQLAKRAQAVCRHYLPAGRRERSQWRVGDVRNTPGRSMFVQLAGPTRGRGAAGRWRDAATGEHGDLIDLIQNACRLTTMADTLIEAKRFLGIRGNIRHELPPGANSQFTSYDPMKSVARLIAEAGPIAGTLAEVYLQNRGICHGANLNDLRFHPACPCRDPITGHFSRWPAMIAIATDLAGGVTGLQRTYLSPTYGGKANIATPRKSFGSIRGHGVRFGIIDDVALFGEGVETVLSLKEVTPTMPMVATLSADNLGVCVIPHTLRRLYIATDPDHAGFAGAKALLARANRLGVQTIRLVPVGEDFNADLVERGASALRHNLAKQFHVEDFNRFASLSACPKDPHRSHHRR